MVRYYLVLKQWPEVEVTSDDSSVYHAADWSLVTSAEPARAGEVLIVRGKGSAQPD